MYAYPYHIKTGLKIWSVSIDAYAYPSSVWIAAKSYLNRWQIHLLVWANAGPHWWCKYLTKCTTHTPHSYGQMEFKQCVIRCVLLCSFTSKVSEHVCYCVLTSNVLGHFVCYCFFYEHCHTVCVLLCSFTSKVSEHVCCVLPALMYQACQLRCCALMFLYENRTSSELCGGPH